MLQGVSDALIFEFSANTTQRSGSGIRKVLPSCIFQQLIGWTGNGTDDENPKPQGPTRPKELDIFSRILCTQGAETEEEGPPLLHVAFDPIPSGGLPVSTGVQDPID